MGVGWTQVESNLLRVIRRSFIAIWGDPIVVRDARPIEDSLVGVLSAQRRFSGDVSASGLWFLPGKQHSQVQALQVLQALRSLRDRPKLVKYGYRIFGRLPGLSERYATLGMLGFVTYLPRTPFNLPFHSKSTAFVPIVVVSIRTISK